MSRGERRRRKRELEKRGIGLGWRYSLSGRRRYPVVEPPERTLEELDAESEAMGLSAPEDVLRVGPKKLRAASILSVLGAFALPADK